MIACRALSLTSGAQASSRSRNTWSAGRPWAFSRKRGLLPGTARQDRRGRSRPAVTGAPSAGVILRLWYPAEPARAWAGATAGPGRFRQDSASADGGLADDEHLPVGARGLLDRLALYGVLAEIERSALTSWRSAGSGTKMEAGISRRRERAYVIEDSSHA